MNSQLGVTFRASGFRFRFGDDWEFIAFADVDFNHLEVFHVCDESVVILIDALEDVFSHIIGAGDTQELVGGIDESGEFFQSHLALRSLGHLSSSVISLETHLTAVPLEEEVAEFNKGDGSRAVDVKTEDVLHHIVDLILRFLLENINNDLFDGLDLNFFLSFDVG